MLISIYLCTLSKTNRNLQYLSKLKMLKRSLLIGSQKFKYFFLNWVKKPLKMQEEEFTSIRREGTSIVNI